MRWVSEVDLGTGPFCWEIYQGKEGRLLATSESFYLPGSSGTSQQIDVVLP